ncbi:MAG: transglutaminase-like domain-containing protein, partial [Vitreimonas sp.]
LLLERARPFVEHFDFNGHYSALDTVTRRAGDCTEAAVLLAALGRAAGIPTRVASGLAYSRASYHGVSNAFVPHSWTLAFVDGQWRSFDLALEAFDSTHIALTVGDGDARSIAAAGQLASLLRFDGLAEVRPRS